MQGRILSITIASHEWSLVEPVGESEPWIDMPGLPVRLDQRGMPFVMVTINGQVIEAVLDSGARGTILNEAAADLVGLAAADVASARGEDIRGVDQAKSIGSRTGLATILLGDPYERTLKVRIADLPVFAALGFATGPALILGADFLANARLVLDFDKRCLWLTINGTGKIDET